MKAPVLIGVLCLASGNALGRDVGNCDAARPVVERYIALDLQGEGTRASKKMAQLIDYQDRDTAGWDSFTLTSESRIKDCRESGGQVVITVVHRVFGSVGAPERNALARIMARPVTEEETSLRLNKTPQGWKIDSPTVYVPHVGVDAAKRLFAWH